MAVTEVLKDLEFPMPGQELVFTATCSTAGNEVQFRVTQIPIGSTIELWDEGKKNWLPSAGSTTTARFTPDVKGLYYIDAVEIQVKENLPTFSNMGSVNGYTGIVQRSEVGSPESCVLEVGTTLKRTIGIQPHTCTLTLRNGSDSQSLITSGTDGVVTYYADHVGCPRLSEPSDPIADMAMRDSNVCDFVATIGGTHGLYTYSGSQKVIDWADVIDSDPLTSIGWLNLAINSHIRSYVMWIHSAADTVNVVTAADPTVGDATSQITSINDIRTQLLAHFAQTSTPDSHEHADTTSGISIGAALAPGASLTLRLERANQINAAYNLHRIKTYQTLVQPSAYTTVVHSVGADGSGDDQNASIANSATTESELVSLLVTLKSAYESHRATAAILGGGTFYHNMAGDADNTWEDTLPTDIVSYTRTVNGLLDVLGDHVLNIKHSDGTSETYHNEPDYENRTDSLPRAADGDMATAVALHEILVWLFMRHIRTSGRVHQINNNLGSWETDQSGVGYIATAFYGAVVASDATTVPPNEVPSEYALIQLGGFTPA